MREQREQQAQALEAERERALEADRVDAALRARVAAHARCVQLRRLIIRVGYYDYTSRRLTNLVRNYYVPFTRRRTIREAGFTFRIVYERNAYTIAEHGTVIGVVANGNEITRFNSNENNLGVAIQAEYCPW